MPRKNGSKVLVGKKEKFKGIGNSEERSSTGADDIDHSTP
jgi:hypothetical protein